MCFAFGHAQNLIYKQPVARLTRHYACLEEHMVKWPSLKRRRTASPESQKGPELSKEPTEEPILEYKETIVAEERPARPPHTRQPVGVKRSGWENAAMVEEKVDVIVSKGTTSGPGTTLERKVDRTLEKKKVRR